MFFSLRILYLHLDVGSTLEFPLLEPEPVLLGFGDILVPRVVSLEEILALGVSMELDELLHRIQLQSLREVGELKLLLLLGHDL